MTAMRMLAVLGLAWLLAACGTPAAGLAPTGGGTSAVVAANVDDVTVEVRELT